MFRRTETARERALLRLIEQLERIIDRQNDRIMVLAGRPFIEEPPPYIPEVEAEPFDFAEAVTIDEEL